MNNASYFTQTNVYFKKLARIALKERFWKFLVFAAIIAVIVAAVVGGKMFETYESTKSGFFTIASACIWIGIFNSIQSVCKEHEIIRAEYRSGMKLSSYIMANVRWQFLLCLMESIIIFVLCIIFINFNSNGIIMWAYLEYFLSIFLMTFGASVMGIMVSSIAGNPTTAMTIMPFVLILQLIMSGVLFELDGVSKIIAYITFSKWGMSAFGSIADMNSPDLTLKLVDEVPELGPMLNPRPESMIDAAYDHEASNLLIAWAACLIITVVCIAVSIISLKLKNRDS